AQYFVVRQKMRSAGNGSMSQPVDTKGKATNLSWRESFLRTTLIIACVFGIGALIPAVLTTSPLYAIAYIAIYLLVLLVTVLPVSYQIRAFTLIGLLYGL